MEKKTAKLPLIIVESPTKAKVIQSYFAGKIIVMSSSGHIMDLPKSRIGIDIQNNFNPEMEILPGKNKIITALLKSAKQAKSVYIASDPDREGEFIGKCLYDLILPVNKNIHRLRLHEITKKAISEQLENPRKLDMQMIESQSARRIIDRLSGYSISPYLWKRIQYKNLSAGRVQSVLLKWICVREVDITNFKESIYYTLSIHAQSPQGDLFEFRLITEDNEKINNPETLETILSELGFNSTGKKIQDQERAIGIITKIQKNRKKIFPPSPFTTSSMQEDAFKKLGFSPSKTMKLAQALYEGVQTPNGMKSFVSYIRTDSTRVNSKISSELKSNIQSAHGDQYAGISRSSKQKFSQGAHEAIRPVDLSNSPEKSGLQGDLLSLYKLIYNRFYNSGLAPEDGINYSIYMKSGDHSFIATNRMVLFDGFKKGKQVKTGMANPESLKEGMKMKFLGANPEEKKTEPPERYSEGSLIKKMEKTGIGRPSSYATSIMTLYKRKYIYSKNKKLFPSSLGLQVNSILMDQFHDFISDNFTIEMEKKLDQIAGGKMNKIQLLKEFYSQLTLWLKTKPKKDTVDQKGYIVKPVIKEICPSCKKGSLIKKTTKHKKPYKVCSKFPDCEYIVYIN